MILRSSRVGRGVSGRGAVAIRRIDLEWFGEVGGGVTSAGLEDHHESEEATGTHGLSRTLLLQSVQSTAIGSEPYTGTARLVQGRRGQTDQLPPTGGLPPATHGAAGQADTSPAPARSPRGQQPWRSNSPTQGHGPERRLTGTRRDDRQVLPLTAFDVCGRPTRPPPLRALLLLL
jgi:hypothetical protein